MKLLGSAKRDVDQDKDREDVPKLETAEIVLVHCNLSITIISKHLGYYFLLYQINNLDS